MVTHSSDSIASNDIVWTQNGEICTALWRSERGASAPKRVVLADDTLTADAAYQLACAGTSLLWEGDFQNARQLLQALARRCDAVPARKRRKASTDATPPMPGSAETFHLHRQAKAQRARLLGMLLIPLNPDYSIALRRAPDLRQACTHAWGPPEPQARPSVVSLRELMGLGSANEWRRLGVEVLALGSAPNNRIYPHYGVFSPVRGEYVDLVAQATLPVAVAAVSPPGMAGAFDIGVGSGVLSAVLARRGVNHIVATDQDTRALDCARANLVQLGVGSQVTLVQTNLFPPGKAALVVCNPPWLPARASSPIERAVYDDDSQMLRGFLAGLAAHLAPSGEGWLILSDLAEHLGLRSRAELLAWITAAGLTVLGRMDTRPIHGKANRGEDTLHYARAAEITSLWRLGATSS